MSGLPVNTKYELSDLIPVGIAFAVVIIDQLTKLWIMTAFALHEQQTIIPGFFDLVYVTNTGAAFGFLAGSKSLLRQAFFVAVVVDFLDFYIGSYHWPAFNAADSAITLGVGLFLLGTLLQHQEQKREDN